MGYASISNLYKDKKILAFKQVYALEKVHGCVKEDSQIHMHDGTIKQIKDIKKGDIVVSYDLNTKNFVNSEVTSVVIQDMTEHLEWYEFEFENGKILVCTEDHPILTTEGWVCARDITEKYDIVSI
jgi:intein/homing endonuclease